MQDSDELLNAFVEEAREHLPVIEASLLALDQRPEDTAVLNALFRSVHTIKGGAGFFGLKNIGSLAHGMESLLSLARNREIVLSRAHVDTLLAGQDLLQRMIDFPLHSDSVDVGSVCLALDNLLSIPYAPSKDIERHDPGRHSDMQHDAVPASFSNSRSETLASSAPPLETLHVAVRETSSASDFISEARECTLLIEACLIDLEVDQRNATQLDALFRHVHTLSKGATSLGLKKLAELSAQMEEVIGQMKSAQLLLDDDSLDMLFEAHTRLMQLLERPEDTVAVDITDVCHKLKLLGLGQAEDTVDTVTPTPGRKKLEITGHKQDMDLLLHDSMSSISKRNEAKPFGQDAEQAEPDSTATLAAIRTLRDTETGQGAVLETEESIRVHVKRLNKLIDLAGELVLVRNQLFRLCEPMVTQMPGLKAALHNFNRITTEMQEEIMSTRMQPIGVVFNKFPRLIRQLEKDLGKQLELVTEGADVELDKTIIESLADPVTHIIRNMADHGIEAPAERLAKGKPASGTLVQKAFHESGQVVIQFSDDGAGIDPEFIAAKALQKGIVTAEALEKMPAKDKLNLIFTPGFSTAAAVSSVSGRGIGMDVVKTKIEQIGGTVDVQSEPGKWTTLTMTLPLTMAIISALIVRVQNCRFAFPQGHLEEMVLLQPEHYATRVGQAHGQRMLALRGDFLPLISLAESLHLYGSHISPAGTNPPGADLRLPEESRTGQSGTIRQGEGIKKAENLFIPPHSNPLPEGEGICSSTASGSWEPAVDKPLPIIIVKAENNRIAVSVDQILGCEEIVVKPMPEHFRHIKNFSGTTILGDGAIALIIDVQGYIHRNQLAYTELRKSLPEQSEHKVAEEPQSLLIFDNNSDERFALPLSWIQRIDALDVKRIQHCAGYDYIEYRGEQMRLLHLEHCLPLQKPARYNETAHIIIPKHTKVPVALLINRVIDSRNTVIKLENTGAKMPGILGSMILDGKITLMLDLHGILQANLPESVEKMDINPERAGSQHILLVEDTPFFMRVTKEFITAAGYQVSSAVNGREGLEMLGKQHFDLVLSDIEMPLMDGREMIKNIRANPKWRDLPVIALTTLSDAQTIQDGKRAGFNDWLVKLDKELVLKTLAQYL